MQVKDIMNKNVMTVQENTNLREAIILMTDNHIGSLVVIKNGNLIGIITERDILIKLAKEDDCNLDETEVKNIMTKWIITTTPEMSIENASELIKENKIKKLPVLKNEKLVGIITLSDIINHPKLFEEYNSLRKIKK